MIDAILFHKLNRHVSKHLATLIFLPEISFSKVLENSYSTFFQSIMCKEIGVFFDLELIKQCANATPSTST